MPRTKSTKFTKEAEGGGKKAGGGLPGLIVSRTKSTKFTKGAEGGGKKAGGGLPGLIAKASDGTTAQGGTKRKVDDVPPKGEDARIREGRDFYRISGGVPDARNQQAENSGLAPGAGGAEEKPENQIAKAVVNTAFQVHTALGPGLLESVYEVVMAHELRGLGFEVQRQVPIAICYKDITFEKAFLADLLVDGKVIVELKSVEQLAPIHSKQLLTQIRLMQKRLGLLINFGSIHLKENIRRLANGLERPPGSPSSL